jgi:hypothetical protein
MHKPKSVRSSNDRANIVFMDEPQAEQHLPLHVMHLQRSGRGSICLHAPCSPRHSLGGFVSASIVATVPRVHTVKTNAMFRKCVPAGHAHCILSRLLCHHGMGPERILQQELLNRLHEMRIPVRHAFQCSTHGRGKWRRAHHVVAASQEHCMNETRKHVCW